MQKKRHDTFQAEVFRSFFICKESIPGKLFIIRRNLRVFVCVLRYRISLVSFAGVGQDKAGKVKIKQQPGKQKYKRIT